MFGFSFLGDSGTITRTPLLMFWFQGGGYFFLFQNLLISKFVYLMVGRNMAPSYVIYIWSTWKKILPRHQTLSEVVVFAGASIVPLGVQLLKIYNTKLTVMHGVKHNVSLFFNSVSKRPIVKYMIPYHTEIYNVFIHGIYHKTHSIFK